MPHLQYFNRGRVAAGSLFSVVRQADVCVCNHLGGYGNVGFQAAGNAQQSMSIHQERYYRTFEVTLSSLEWSSATLPGWGLGCCHADMVVHRRHHACPHIKILPSPLNYILTYTAGLIEGSLPILAWLFRQVRRRCVARADCARPSQTCGVQGRLLLWLENLAVENPLLFSLLSDFMIRRECEWVQTLANEYGANESGTLSSPSPVSIIGTSGRLRLEDTSAEVATLLHFVGQVLSFHLSLKALWKVTHIEGLSLVQPRAHSVQHHDIFQHSSLSAW